MKYALRLSIMLGLQHLMTASAMAQVAPQCERLEQRAERQDRIREAYQCQRGARADELQLSNRLWHRCARVDQFILGKALNRRAAAIEQCIERRLVTQGPIGRPIERPLAGGSSRDSSALPAPRLAQPSAPRSSAQPPDLTNEPLVDLLGSRPDPQPAIGRLVETPNSGTQRASDGGPRQSPGPLLEQAPATSKVDRDLTFRTGLMWSYSGPISGMACTQWIEPSDPDSWDDNYLCAERDVGFQWSYRGPIQGRGLNCIQVREKSDPHDWHDNYFCWPRDLKVTFRFSATGRVDGYRCLAIVEPSDPHTWRDNYLCHRPEENGQ